MPTKVHTVHTERNTGLSSIHVAMQVLDYKEGWAPKIWCFQTVVLEKTPESPLVCWGDRTSQS